MTRHKINLVGLGPFQETREQTIVATFSYSAYGSPTVPVKSSSVEPWYIKMQRVIYLMELLGKLGIEKSTNFMARSVYVDNNGNHYVIKMSQEGAGEPSFSVLPTMY